MDALHGAFPLYLGVAGRDKANIGVGIFVANPSLIVNTYTLFSLNKHWINTYFIMNNAVVKCDWYLITM